ncbi:MAG: hypothetical protein EHM28_09085 [Spirochaetaceae bacterium]|nr:MAG: hypothetical protein EHM28_09085 [Spirochaetaceae bacterium]
MTNIIHYEDDIFFLSATAKKLADSLMLELDPSLFADKIISEINYLSKTIEYFMNQLKTTTLKVNRQNYLKSIFLVNKQYIDILTGILSGKYPFSIHLSGERGSMEASKLRHTEFSSELEDTLAGINKTPGEKDVISEEEYKILFTPDQEEE